MKELIKFVQKYRFFKTFLGLFETGGGVICWKRCRECLNMSGTNWKIPSLSLGKMTYFPHLVIFSQKNLALLPT